MKLVGSFILYNLISFTCINAHIFAQRYDEYAWISIIFGGAITFLFHLPHHPLHPNIHNFFTLSQIKKLIFSGN